MRTVNQSASFAFASNVAVNSVVVGLRALRHLQLGRISAKAGRGTKWTTTSIAITGTPAIGSGGSSLKQKPGRSSESTSCLAKPDDRNGDCPQLAHAFPAMHQAEYVMYPATPVIAG